FGNYYALVIGNRNYRDPAFEDLKNSERDARAIGDLLRSRYGMQVTTVIDGTREDIFGALGRIKVMGGPGDSVLIYYAGHGKLEKIPEKQYIEGYWLPVDASLSNQAYWIDTDEINKSMKAMNADHVLVIADSCYAGSQFRSTPEVIMRRELLERMNQKKARVLLTSGGQEDKALEAGFGDHSVFAQALLDNLGPNRRVILSSELFQMVKEPVISAANAFGHEQTPQYGPISTAGDQGGEFFFVPRGAAMAAKESDPRVFAALRLQALGYDADPAGAAVAH
ncbi:MAG: caspase family protein, partial [Allosphingosinicella sp.]